jgi:hypothetical protein
MSRSEARVGKIIHGKFFNFRESKPMFDIHQPLDDDGGCDQQAA